VTVCWKLFAAADCMTTVAGILDIVLNHTPHVTNVNHRINPNESEDRKLFRRENKLKNVNGILSSHVAVEFVRPCVKAIQIWMDERMNE
jgi:hypothetical protein